MKLQRVSSLSNRQTSLHQMNYNISLLPKLWFNLIKSYEAIDLWQHHKERTKHSIAALNIAAKIAAIRTASATSATALAIGNATDVFNSSQE